ncbi:MAG: ATP-binding cassette domain-containing protein [Spirochaetales bacterium]|nr:ATP-binding cassette domain-containing protein [Spirochaetales bacterium]
MIQVSDVSLAFGKRELFKNVNIIFTPGNCYGLIGANGSGKSTFLKILAGELEPATGAVTVGKGLRVAVLRQDQSAFDEHEVTDTVVMGHKKLHDILAERAVIYAKSDFSEADGHRAAELEDLVAGLNGYEAEAEAATLLAGLGIEGDALKKKMGELTGAEKIRVLLAQALFGNPDILLLDEPTNHLDLESVAWLENFLERFDNTVIVVSHDRHFINRVCTHIADIDYGKIQVYPGNFDYWAEASQLALRQKKEENRKREEKAKELKAFIQRFSANASKSRQATSRKKLLEKLAPEEIPPSSRRFPYIAFKPDRECGNVILGVQNASKSADGRQVLGNFSLEVAKGEKIAFFGPDNLAKTLLFRLLMGEEKPDAGSVTWGETITTGYFPKDPGDTFDGELSIVEWLAQFARDKDETLLRGFLGRMLFSGDEALKKTRVLSGGEKVRCLLARLMQTGANVLVLDEPTNHLDLEAITSLNNALIAFPGVVLFSSHDHQFVDTVANRVIEITPSGVIDRSMRFDDYLESPEVQALRDEMYHGHIRLSLE